MVTCVRPSLNSMLPMAPVNPFVVGLTPSVMATAAVAVSNHTATTVTTMTTLSTSSTPTKPKLAFSIDAIVGGNGNNGSIGKEQQQPQTALSPISISQRSDSPDDYERSPKIMRLTDINIAPTHCQQALELRNSFPVIYARSGSAASTLAPLTPTTPQRGLIYCRRRSSLDRDCSVSRSSTPLRCRSRSPRTPRSSPTPNHNSYSPAARPSSSHQKEHFQRSRSPTPNRRTPSNSPTPASKAAPILVPGLLPSGLIRPLPLPLPPHATPNQRVGNEVNTTNMPPLSQSSVPTHQTALPSNVIASTHPTVTTQGPPPPPHPPNPHFLAAQFQMAAALAHHHQQQQQQQQQHHHHHHPPPHLPPTHPMGIFPPGPPHPHFGGPHLIRDSYPLYPWLLSRHGRIFPHRFPGFLLQPFRKPKRVRTAFSPTQLLKLEHAFEGNHYVVGAERKQLAQGLSLTETQVKVWFQNRRTKHKRMQQEGGDSDSKSNKGDNDGKNDSSQHSYSDHEDDEIDEHDEEGECVGDDDDEDEVIDMDDYGSEIDAEEQQRMREHLQEQASREHQQQQQHSPFLSLQQQQQNFQQQHQQFMQHQLYLQQQQHQQQQQQQQQKQKQQ